MKSVAIKVLSLVLLIATVSIGHSQTSKEQLSALNSTLERYRSTIAVESSLKQEVSNILDQTTESEGKIWLSKGKMKIRFEKPELVDVVFDGQWLWQAQKAPEEFGGQWQVLKMKTNDLKKSNAGVALLFDKGSVEKKFKVLEIKQNKNEVSYFLQPKDLKNSSLKKINVVIDKEAKRVNRLTLEDQAETITKLNFFGTTFGAEVSDKMFKYIPPKGAEVSTL